MQEKIRRGIFAFLFIVLGLPIAQQCVPFIDDGRLYGYASNVRDISFSWDKWFDGAYQNKKDSFCNDHIGFRNDLIRVNNQIEYWLYDRVFGGGTLGKNHCLFYDDYILSYYGVDYQGHQVIYERLKKLKAIQDTMARMGKSLIIVYAPCKAYFYPENIPDRFRGLQHRPTNFQAFLHIGDSLGFHQIDLNSWFVSMKNKSKELLYPGEGTHWSVYGSFLGGDSIVKYIEKLKNIRLPHPSWLRVEHVINARETDDDLSNIANLIFPISREVYSYPIVNYKDDTTAKKINVIFIGDSFVMNLVTNGIIPNEFADWQFWLYNKVLCSNNNTWGEEQTLKDTDYWKGAINKTDCLIFMYTAHTLFQFGNGFIERAYDYYYPGKNSLL